MINIASADPDFSKEVLEDLYSYSHKHRGLALILAIAGGLFGVHRFYLNRPLTGIVRVMSDA